jgi:hypothetical protein
MSIAVVALSLVACGRRDVDVRAPLGASIAGAKPFTPVRNANAQAFVIPSTAGLKPATYANEQAVRGRAGSDICGRDHGTCRLRDNAFEPGRR